MDKSTALVLAHEAHLGLLVYILVFFLVAVLLEKICKISPIETIRILLSEVKDLADLKPSAGALNFGTVIFALIVMAAYFFSQTFRDILQASLAVGGHVQDEGSSCFVVCFIAVLTAIVLSTLVVKLFKD